MTTRKGEPQKRIDWRRLALAIALRYATYADQCKTKKRAAHRGFQDPISSNRLAPFYSATVTTYSVPFTK